MPSESRPGTIYLVREWLAIRRTRDRYVLAEDQSLQVSQQFAFERVEDNSLLQPPV